MDTDIVGYPLVMTNTSRICGKPNKKNRPCGKPNNKFAIWEWFVPSIYDFGDG